MYRILAVNPGSTSTKLAVFEDETAVLRSEVRHENLEEIRSNMIAQIPIRVEHIRKFLSENGCEIQSFDMIACRCGGILPAPARIYRVSQLMRDVQVYAPTGNHASQLGGPIAWELARGTDVPIVAPYPPNVDEMAPVAKISGLPEIRFPAGGHQLNVRTVSRMTAEEMGFPFEDGTFIVAHMGGGITISAVSGGKTVDVIRSYEGPMSGERSGTLPLEEAIDLCYSGVCATKEDMITKINFNAGLYAYTGTRSVLEVVQRAEAGDERCAELLEAMCYQTAKSIGSLSAALKGRTDAIILTGSIVRNTIISDTISEYVDWIAPVKVIPGEREMEGLAGAALRVLRGEETACKFDLIPPPYESEDDFYRAISRQ